MISILKGRTRSTDTLTLYVVTCRTQTGSIHQCYRQAVDLNLQLNRIPRSARMGVYYGAVLFSVSMPDRLTVTPLIPDSPASRTPSSSASR